MKSRKYSIDKILLASGIIGIILLSFLLYWIRKETVKMTQPKLKFVQGTYIPVDTIDPAKIRVLDEYHLVRSIYSPLIEYSHDGQIIGGLANRFYWQGNDLIFEIRNNFYSSKGDLIDASDAEFSIKRLLVLASNSHGDLRKIFCGNRPMISINDDCPGIKSSGNILTLKFDTKRPYLVSIFSNMDFAILPKKSIDPISLKILDHKNTSGPYIIDSENGEKKEIVLKARPEHWHYNASIPQVVHLSPFLVESGRISNPEEKVEGFKQGEVDVLSTISFFDFKSGIKLAEDNKKIQVYRTQNIAVSMLFFTDRGQTKFNEGERLFLGKLLRSKMAVFFEGNKFGRKPTFEYFPRSGAGHLDDEQIDQIQKILDNISEEKSGPILAVKAKIGVHPQTLKMAKKIFGENSDFFELITREDNFLSQDKNNLNPADAQILVTDVSFNEDFNLLSYTESLGVFPYTSSKNKKWLQDYMLEENEATRLNMTKNLHFEMLKSGRIVPLSSLPYLALSKKPWKLNFSPLFAGSPLWQIEYED